MTIQDQLHELLATQATGDIIVAIPLPYGIEDAIDFLPTVRENVKNCSIPYTLSASDTDIFFIYAIRERFADSLYEEAFLKKCKEYKNSKEVTIFNI